MDDLKLYGKTMQEIHSLVQTVRFLSRDIGMQFRISMCAAIEIKRDKDVKSEGIEWSNGETVIPLEDENGCKYLGVLQFDCVKSKEMKDNKGTLSKD